MEKKRWLEKRKRRLEKIINYNNKKMSLPDIRLYVMNGSALGVTTFTQIEDWLKIILLIVTIGYTIAKWSKVKDEENK